MWRGRFAREALWRALRGRFDSFRAWQMDTVRLRARAPSKGVLTMDRDDVGAARQLELLEDEQPTQPAQPMQRRIRPRTENRARYSKQQLAADGMLYPEDTRPLRPKTRGECVDGPRPCPFVSCRHHLYLDVMERSGSVRFNFPNLEVWELEETCALDVADRGGMTLVSVGRMLNVTRERVRQVEMRSLARMRAKAEGDDGVTDYLEGFDHVEEA